MRIGKKILLQVLFICLITSVLSVTKVQAQDLVGGQRIAGSDRYQTSIKISQFGWKDGVDTAVIATGDDFPDALSAAPLAAKFKAPILLTDSKILDKTLYDELIRLKVKNVYIAGGIGVVSKSIENQLTKKGIKCNRVFGDDRYGTSVAIAKQLDKTDKAIIATGADFPDALSIAPWAAQNGIPILLTGKDELPASIEQYIKDNNVTETYVIGGKGVISDECISKLPNPKRISGEDRYGTNYAVLKEFEGEFDFGKIYFATGNNFPDALSGSALTNMTKSPVVLADGKPSDNIKSFIDIKKENVSDVYIMGGESVVPNAVVNELIPPMVSKIEISLNSDTLSLNGKVKPEIKVIMIPQNATAPDVSLSSSDSSILKVNKDRTITGINTGSAKLTATAGDKSVTTDIRVVLNGTVSNKTVMIDPGHGGGESGAVPTAVDGTKLQQYKEATLNMQVAQKLKKRLADAGFNVLMTRDGDTTLSLPDRAKLANDKKVDLFISVHHDSTGHQYAHGTSAFYSTYRTYLDTKDVYAVAQGNKPVYDENKKVIGTMSPTEKYPFVQEVNSSEIKIMYKGKVAVTSLDDVMLYDSTPNDVCKDSKILAEAINEGIASLGLNKRGAKDQNLAVTRLTNMTSLLFEVGFISSPDEFNIISQDSFQEKVADKVAEAIINFYKNKSSSSDTPATASTTP